MKNFNFKKNIALFVVFTFISSQILFAQEYQPVRPPALQLEKTAGETLDIPTQPPSFPAGLPVQIMTTGQFLQKTLTLEPVKNENQIPDTGSMLNGEKKWLTENTVATEVYHFEYGGDYERYDFKDVVELLRPEYAAAVIVKSLDDEAIETLAHLSVETGILVLDGEIVLFTSGSGDEIGVLPAVKELVNKASLVSHTHPGVFSKEGPSGADINAAVSAPGEEYVITQHGVYAYNADGVLNNGNPYSYAWYLAKLNQAVLDSGKQNNSAAARSELNQFIAAEDRYNLAALGEEETLRMGGTLSYTPGLTSANVTTLTGTPYPYIAVGSTPATTLSASSNQFLLGYSVPGTNDISGFTISFDNATTTAVETQDISALSNLTFGLKGPNTSLKLEVIDINNNKDTFTLTNISTTAEQFWNVPVPAIASTLDKTKIRQLNFIVGQANTTATTRTGTLYIRSGGLNTNAPAQPVVTSTIPIATNMTTLTFLGTKEANAAVLVNGVEVVARNVSTAWSATVNLATEGNNSFSITLKNSIGKLSTAKTFTILRDTIPPAGSMAINSGAGYTNSRTVTLNLSAADAGSGMGLMHFSSDGGTTWSTWETFAATKTLTLPAGDGPKTVKCEFKDKTGNIASGIVKSIILDTLAPEGTLVINPPVPQTVDALTFDPKKLTSVTGQDINAAQFELLDGGKTLHMWGNNWKQLDLGAQIAADTLLEFDFKSAGAVPEISAIGFDNNPQSTSNLTAFQFQGTQNWAAKANYTYSKAGDWQHFVIRAGDYFTGSFRYLFFVNDADTGQAANVYFRNVKIWQPGTGDTIPFEEKHVSSVSNAGQDVNPTQYELAEDGRSLHLWGNNWKALNNPGMQISANTILEFDFKSVGNMSEINAIGFSSSRDESVSQSFQVYGSQDYWRSKKRLAYVNNGDWQHFVIRAGDYFTGNFDYLIFANDADTGPVASVFYRNIKLYNQSATLNSASVKLLLGGYDVTSGMDAMRFSPDGGATWTNWEAYASSKILALPTVDGARQIQGQFRDKSGNVLTVSQNVTVSLPHPYLTSAPVTDQINYTLKYRIYGVEKTKNVVLNTLGDNTIQFTDTLPDGSTFPLSFTIKRVKTMRQGDAYVYDADGNITLRTDSAGNQTTLGYNTLNQLVSMNTADGSSALFNYDKNGNLIQMIDGRGTTTYLYDNLNRLTKMTMPGNKSISYTYDLAGNLTQLVYPDNTTIIYHYDADNRLDKVTQGTDITTYAYNKAGDLTEQVLPDGIKTAYGYDADGRLIAITNTKAATGALIQSFAYTLDQNGNRTQVVETLPSGAKTTLYTYDKLNRLSRAQYPDGHIVTYTYDAAGNRKTMLEQTSATDAGMLSTYSYGIENRLEKLTKVNQTTLQTVSEELFYYDPRGNMLAHVYPDHAVRYTYDLRNLLVQVDDGQTVTKFVYDGLGNRVAKIVNGVRTDFVVETSGGISEVLQELNSSGVVTKNYTLGLNRISVAASGAKNYFVTDGLGSTTLLADSTGTVKESYTYDAFGNILTPASPSTSFLFAGEQRDSETGLVYLRARYYDPITGRFISKDPVIGQVDQPQSFNPYPYVQNNPINFIDPLGQKRKIMEIAVEIGPDGKPDDAPWLQGGIRLKGGVVISAQGTSPYVSIESELSVKKSIKIFNVIENNESWGVRDNARFHEKTTNPYLEIPICGPYSFKIDPAQTSLKTSLKVSQSDRSWGEIEASFPNSYIQYSPIGLGATLASDRNLLDNENVYWGGSIGWGSGIGSSFYDDSRGGVLIDKAATLIGANLSQITGATFDPVTGQLILLGTNDAAVPDIRVDDLITALKAVYGSIDSPGVDIGNPPDPNETVDNMRPNQNVTLFGGLENTDLGWVVFEADRMMKCLAAGKDNITGASVAAKTVPTYKNMLDRWAASGNGGHSRFWFVPDAMNLTRSSDGNSFVFSQAKVKILTEDMLIGGGATDPTAEAFAKDLTDHFDDYAKEFPIFERLRQVMKAVALARFIKDNNIPIDLSWLEDYQEPVVATPATTPTVFNQKVWTEGNMIHTLKIAGGVKIDGQNNYLADTGSAVSFLAQTAENARGSAAVQNWQVTSGGSTYNAVALSLAPQNLVGNFSTVQTDLSVPTAGDLTLGLTRYYDSFEGSKSPFGHDWKVDPYVAEFEKPAYQNSVESGRTEFNGFREGKVRILDRATGKELTFNSKMVITETLDGYVTVSGLNYYNGLPVYEPVGVGDGSVFFMNPDKTYLWTRQDGSSVLFDTNGQILKETDRLGKFIQYNYTGGRLSSVSDSSSRSINLTYDANGRVTGIAGPLGLSVTYGYSTAGDLTSVKDNRTGLVTTYAYDANHNLTGSVDPFGYSDFGNTFDVWGMASSQKDERGNVFNRTYDRATDKETVTNTAIGKSLVREYDAQQRVIKETDYLGNVTTFTYDGENRLPATIKDPKGHIVTLQYDGYGCVLIVKNADDLNSFGATVEYNYDSKGNVIWSRDAKDVVRNYEYDSASNLTKVSETLSATQTVVTQFTYDAAGNLTSVKNPNNQTTIYTYDSLGNLTEAKDAFGNTERLSYDSLYRLKGVTDEMSRTTNYSYNNLDQLTTIQTALGTVRFGYDTKGNLTTFTDARQNVTSYTFDPATGDLLQTIDPDGKVARFTYDAFGRLKTITDPNGYVTIFKYDELGRVTYVGADGIV